MDRPNRHSLPLGESRIPVYQRERRRSTRGDNIPFQLLNKSNQNNMASVLPRKDTFTLPPGKRRDVHTVSIQRRDTHTVSTRPGISRATPTESNVRPTKNFIRKDTYIVSEGHRPTLQQCQESNVSVDYNPRQNAKIIAASNNANTSRQDVNTASALKRNSIATTGNNSQSNVTSDNAGTLRRNTIPVVSPRLYPLQHAAKEEPVLQHAKEESIGLTNTKLSQKKTFVKTCNFCGRQCLPSSLTRHEKQCQLKNPLVKPNILPVKMNPHKPSKSSSQYEHGGVVLSSKDGEKPCIDKQARMNLQFGDTDNSESLRDIPKRTVARVVTVGLTPGQFETTYVQARPGTRHLPYSSLQDAGYALPSSSENRRLNNPSNFKQCEKCGNIIPCDRMDVHLQVCANTSMPLGRGHPQNKQFRLGKKPQSPPSKSPVKPLVLKKPPTVVCYICGREYGSASIGIHEPQCLKKFIAENMKLPIRERRPLPKKEQQISGVIQGLSRDDRELVQSELPEKLRETLVQSFFLDSYSQFEQSLIPCNKCGRRFSQERHGIHAPNCKAPPLKFKK